MSEYNVRISSDITIAFSSDQPMPRTHRASAVVQSLFDSYQLNNRSGWSFLQIAGNFYRFRYEIITQRVLERATLYNNAIQYIRSQRGVTFNPTLADYAIEKLLEMLDRDW